VALLFAIVILLVLLALNTSFFSSSWCDRRVQRVSDEKDRALKQSLEDLRRSLEQQTATLERIHAARAVARGGATVERRALQTLDESRTAPSQLKQEEARQEQRRDVAAAAQQPTLQPIGSIPEGAAALAAAAYPSPATAGALTPDRIAVVVIAYNRPSYLERTLANVFSHHPGGDAFPVFVSQDGSNEAVTRVVQSHGARSLVHPRRTLQLQGAPAFLRKTPGYAYLSVHYGWALRTLFGAPQRYEGVIILEEDLEVASDFFDYFNATAPLLYTDETLLAVSAFNDNGQPRYASDPAALFRSDFFPGLGWLLSRRLWLELESKWPEERGFWDDWMREPPQRKGRASIRPETSRSRTFGEKGTSHSQFYSKYLAPIQFAPSPAVWAGRDVSFLRKEDYDGPFAAQLESARPVSLDEATALASGGAGGAVRVNYGSALELKKLSNRLGIMEDLKAGVPRTAYRGVVQLRIGGTPVLLAPTFRVDQDITMPLA